MKIEEEHIQLLAEMANLLTLEENFGFVPEFNAKRPFGNSMRAVVADGNHTPTVVTVQGFPGGSWLFFLQEGKYGPNVAVLRRQKPYHLRMSEG